MQRLKNRVALVTGGSRGIGKGAVMSFAEEGADVIFTYKSNDEKAGEVKEQAEQFGVKIHPLKADGASENDVMSVRDFVAKEYSEINILVNNAGILGERKLIRDISLQDFNNVLNTNIGAVFLYSKYIGPLIAKSPVGKIINISSEISKIGAELYGQYAASKGAINVLSMCLARELAPDVLVNVVAPGPVYTDMTLDERNADWYPEFIDKTYPLKRLAEVNEITGIITFLASDEGNYFCGQCIGPNGGASFL